jgi:hypothetical protein
MMQAWINQVSKHCVAILINSLRWLAVFAIALVIAYAWDKAPSPIVRIGVVLLIPLATFISVGIISGWSWRNASPKAVRRTLAKEQAIRRARQASIER